MRELEERLKASHGSVEVADQLSVVPVGAVFATVIDCEEEEILPWIEVKLSKVDVVIERMAGGNEPVTVIMLDVATFPFLSVATSYSVCDAVVSDEVFQEYVYVLGDEVEVTSGPSVLPSR